MKKKFKWNKSKKSIVLVLVLCIITLAYAVLSSRFNINGNATIAASTWSLYFDNINIKEGSVPIRSGGRTPAIPVGSKNTTTLEWDVDLKKPGDFYEFTVDIVNDGNIDAAIETIEKTPELDADQQKVIDYTITYVSNDNELEPKDALSGGEREKIKILVAFKKDIVAADLLAIPDGGYNLSLSIEINYIQADGTQNDVSFGISQLLAKANPLSVTNYLEGDTSEMYTFEQPETSQLPATTDYRYIGETHCYYDGGAYWVPHREGGTCASLYKKDSSGTITYETTCTEEAGVTCTQLNGKLNEIKNYIRYNDEMWRIIGVFDGKLKIIKDEKIGSMPWDAKKSGEGSSDNVDGSNDWTDSQLMYFLNKGNYGKTTYSKVGNFIYDDKEPANLIYEIGKLPAPIESGTYTGAENSWQLNDTALQQIEEVKYYLGGSDVNSDTTETKYIKERSNIRPGGRTSRPTNWTGKVGLMYPSDFGYTYALGVNDKCFTNPANCDKDTGNRYASWLMVSDAHQWTITPHSDGGEQASYAWRIYDGTIYSYYVDSNYDVRPVVYLKTTTMLSGSGTKQKPYRIS